MATIAELSFALLCVIITSVYITDINNLTKNSNLFFLQNINSILFPLIVIAQIFCWIGVISKDVIWNAHEESLWAMFGLSKVFIYLYLYIYLNNYSNLTNKYMFLMKLLPLFIIINLGYSLYMLIYDVPMYINKSRNNKNKILNFFDGIKDLSKCKNVTFSFKKWEPEIIWMSGYFSFAVWYSFILLFSFNHYQNL